MSKRLPFLLVGVFVVLFIWSCNVQRQASPSPTPHGDYQLSDRLQKIQLTTLDGKALDLSAYAGKPIFLNFWATWCGPCRTEMPSIEKAYQKYKDDVVFLAVSTDAPDAIRDYQRQNRYNFSFAKLNVDYLEVYVVKLPTTMLIDGTGNLVLEEESMMLWDQPQNLAKIADLVN